MILMLLQMVIHISEVICRLMGVSIYIIYFDCWYSFYFFIIHFLALICLWMEGVAECEEVESCSTARFMGKCIDITQIPQYIKEYDRGSDVEIWQIKC